MCYAAEARDNQHSAAIPMQEEMVRQAMDGHMDKHEVTADDLDLDWDQITAAHLQFCKDSDLVDQIKEQQRDMYADRWVAVYMEHVAASGAVLEDVLAELDSKGVPRSHTALKYVAKEPMRMIL